MKEEKCNCDELTKNRVLCPVHNKKEIEEQNEIVTKLMSNVNETNMGSDRSDKWYQVMQVLKELRTSLTSKGEGDSIDLPSAATKIEEIFK